MSSVLAAIKKQFQSSRKTTEADYRSLVDSIATEAKVDDTAAAAVLADCGKTPENLDDDVRAKKDRQHWRRALDSEIQASKRLASVGETIVSIEQKHHAKLGNLQQTFDADLSPLISEKDELRQKLADAPRARRKLIETAPRELKEAEAGIQEQMKAAAPSSQLLEAVTDHRQRMRLHERDPRRIPAPTESMEHQELELKQSKKLLDELGEQLDALHARMLEP